MTLKELIEKIHKIKDAGEKDRKPRTNPKRVAFNINDYIMGHEDGMSMAFAIVLDILSEVSDE